MFERWLASKMTTVEWQRFQTELHAPPPEDLLAMDEDEADAVEGAQFLAFMGATTGRSDG